MIGRVKSDRYTYMYVLCQEDTIDDENGLSTALLKRPTEWDSYGEEVTMVYRSPAVHHVIVGVLRLE